MHWVIQNNLYAENGTEALVSILQRRGIPFTAVAMSRTGTLLPDPAHTGAVMVCGSVGLARVAQERGWQPGSFRNANHGHAACVAHWGGAMLNVDARVSAFKDVQLEGERVFIRPAEDSKIFSGGVMEAEEVLAWRGALVRGDRPPVRCSGRMDANTMVLCGPPIAIAKECRFFVVDALPVAWSTYRQGGDPVASPDVDPVSAGFARRCVQAWQPARAFVLDTALTPDGPRIVEVNCINSAGFYSADVEQIVRAVEAMEPWASGVPPGSTVPCRGP